MECFTPTPCCFPSQKRCCDCKTGVVVGPSDLGQLTQPPQGTRPWSGRTGWWDAERTQCRWGALCLPPSLLAIKTPCVQPCHHPSSQSQPHVCNLTATHPCNHSPTRTTLPPSLLAITAPCMEPCHHPSLQPQPHAHHLTTIPPCNYSPVLPSLHSWAFAQLCLAELIKGLEVFLPRNEHCWDMLK